jgi:hypothetical protein
MIHCASHCLTLVINEESKIAAIRNACDVMRETIQFLRECPTRHSDVDFNVPLVCETHWSEKYKSIRVFQQNMDKILNVLDNLATTDSSSKTRSKAFSLKCALEAPQTLFSMTAMAHFSEYIEPLAQHLQSRSTDVTDMARLFDDAKRMISSSRSSESKAQEIYNKASQSAGCEQLATPRIVTNQKHRFNESFESPCEYYRRAMYNPYVDNLLESLTDRFEENEQLFNLLSKLPPNEPRGIPDVAQLYRLDNLVHELQILTK